MIYALSIHPEARECIAASLYHKINQNRRQTQ